MYAQLGDIKFQGLDDLNSFSRSRTNRIAEIPLMLNKSVLQKIGEELQSIELDIFLHTNFTDPAAKLEQLNAYLEDGAILPLISGTGEFYGNFVITALGDSPSKWGLNGEIISTSVNVSLKEYIDFNPESTQQLQARKNGFAIGDKIGAVTEVNRGITRTQLVSISATSVNSNSLQAEEFIGKALAVPAQKGSFLNKASEKLKKAKEGIDAMTKSISENADIASKAPALLASVLAVGVNIDSLATVITTGDLNNISNTASLLSDSLGAFNSANLPIIQTLILRK